MHAHKENGGRGKPRKEGVQFLHGRRVAPQSVQEKLIKKATEKRARRAARRSSA